MTEVAPNIAVIFDFDDTLVPDSTSALLKEYGIDPDKFWLEDVKRLVSAGYDPPLAYLQLILQNIGKNKPFGLLTKADLRNFAKKLNRRTYPGLSSLFVDLTKAVQQSGNGSIGFYVVSGGLIDIIQATKIVKDDFKAAYACELAGDTDDDVLKYIKRSVTFTEKTRFLFEINKGLTQSDTRTNPYLVNKDIPDARRPVPFGNMIYVGDGLTDIPCFSLVKSQGGSAFGVFQPGKQRSAKQVLQELLKTDRVISAHAPRYRRTDELGSVLRASVDAILTKAYVATKEVQ